MQRRNREQELQRRRRSQCKYIEVLLLLHQMEEVMKKTRIIISHAAHDEWDVLFMLVCESSQQPAIYA